jgi:phosphoribosylformimino-5-aminoimidazole carboxamide ribotide isomerase
VIAREFTIYLALDVLQGRVVRLREGRRDEVTFEGGNPVAAAERLLADGATWLHLVDLDGAFSGEPDVGLVERIAALGARVQVGGGYRSLELVASALAAGASRVLIGTAALDDTFLESVAARFGEAVAVAVDVRDDRVAVAGWTRDAAVSPDELARRCVDAGLRRLLVTSTRRDGTLAGPDLPLLERITRVGLPVVAAGGIATLDDLRAVRRLGCEGAVAGSAVWLGRFSLAEAVALGA